MTTDKNPFKVNDYVTFTELRKLPLQRFENRNDGKTEVTVKGVVVGMLGGMLTIDIADTVPYFAKKYYEKTCEAHYKECRLDTE